MNPQGVHSSHVDIRGETCASVRVDLFRNPMYHYPVIDQSTCQKKAVRNVALGSRFSHTDPTFGKLEILKIDDLYSINVGVFMHKYLSSKLPTSFPDMFKFFLDPN